MPFVVYILRCSDGSYYVAHTDDLEHRLAEHQRGAIPGYTHKRRPVALVFADEFGSRVEALERERQVKGWSRAKKEALIAGNWTRLRRLTQAFSGVRKVIRGSALPSASSFPEGLRSAFADPAATLRLRSGRTGSGRLPAGKLPADLLARLLSQVTGGDSR